MILERLESAAVYEKLNPNLKAAFDFLRQENLADLDEDRYEVDGEKVYAMVVRKGGSKKEEVKLEAHKKYIDIHYSVSGTEVFGWKSCRACTTDSEGYSVENDCELYNEPPDSWVSITPGNFALCFPEDAHAPMAMEEIVHKIIVKVEV